MNANYLRKAKECKLSGDLISRQKYFNASIHSYYYSIVHNMNYILREKIGMTEQEILLNSNIFRQKTGKSLHVFTINTVKKSLKLKLNDKDFCSFNVGISRLKFLRNKSDYQNQMIKPREHRNVKFHFGNIFSCLQKAFAI